MDRGRGPKTQMLSPGSVMGSVCCMRKSNSGENEQVNYPSMAVLFPFLYALFTFLVFSEYYSNTAYLLRLW